jgi:phosphate-selective porin OprO/OprP
MKALWCAIISTGLAGAAWAQSGSDGDETNSDRERLRRLEEEVERLKKERALGLSLEGTGENLIQEKKQEPPKSGDFDLKGSFTDGFHLLSTDGNFDLHVGGRVLEEYRFVSDRPVGPAGAPLAAGAARVPPDSFSTREAFLSIDGTLWHDWGFKVNGDFASANANGAALLEEGFMEWKHFKELRIQFGQYKVPQSYEYMGSPRFLEEIQRTAMSRLNPGIEMGIMATGDVADNIFHYWLGVSNGRGHTNSQGRSTVDDNDSKEFEGKLAITPWWSNKESALQKFRIGGYYTRDLQGMGSPGGAAPAGPVTIGNVNTNEFGTTWVTLPGGEYGERIRYGAEFMYAVGPAAIRAEVQRRSDRFQNAGGTVDKRLPFTGYYVTATWFVTGEDKTYVARPKPLHPLDFAGGWGALELVARYSVTSFDWDKFKTLGGSAVDGANTNRVSEVTAGFNWWTTMNTRISVDYVAERYNDPLQFETTGKNRSELGGLLARFQIDF